MIKNGLTERLGEIGKIKIGGKGEEKVSKNGKKFRVPVRYEHFVVTTTERGKDGNYIPDHTVMEQLGQKPKELPIRLLFDDIDMNFFTSFQLYKNSKLRCKGDGERAEWKTEDGEIRNIKCDPENCKHFKAEDCKVSGILSCMIPMSMEIGGVYRFRTHSWNSVSNILAALKYFSENTKGILQGLPLKLKMVKKATEEHGNVNTVTLVIDGIEMMKMREMALLEYENRMKLGIDMKRIEMKAKDAGFMEDKDDPVDVSEEFYPEVDYEIENEETGTTAEDAATAIETKQKENKEPLGPAVEGDDQGSLL